MSDSESVTPSRPPSPLSALPNTARPYRFTWDPSSRRPGPESVSGTTEGRGGGDYFSAQPRLSVLNNSSTAALALGALPQEWSSTKHGFHAISTVLNNPHKRQAPPKAHSSLPPVVPADLPRVRRKDFDPYLGAIGPEWERFQHNSQLGREGVAQLGAGPSTLPDREDDDDDDPTSSHVVALPGPKSVPPLNTVPEVFFQQSFNLGDPRTFNAVTEQSLTESSDPAALAHSLPLLEKFSHYADTVEQHLILEISRRSTSFFAALTNLHDLRAESEHCLTRIASLRRLLTDLDENSAKRGLEAVRRQARADNLVKVVEGVKVVGGVVEMGRVARGLVGAGQWGEALGVIEEMEKMWDGRGDEEEETVVEPSEKLPTVTEEQEEMSPVTARQDRPFLPPSQPTRAKKPPPNVPLSSLKAFSSLPEHLRALTMEIAASLSSELVSVLLADLVERINRGRKGVSTNGVNGNVDVGGLDAGLRDRLRPLLQGLVRTRGVKEGMLSWREVVLGEVRGVVKARLPAIDADDEGGTASGDGQAQANGVEKDGKNMTTQNANTRAGLAAHLRGMRHPEFMLLLQDIYLGLLNCVEGLQAQGRVIVEILETEVNVKELGPPPKTSSTTTTASSVSIPAVQDELADVLSSAAELANTQAAKVISLRVEEHAALELADFLVFFNESWGFVVRCEVLCRKMIVGLRGTVVSQAKVFLQAFHQARISRSAKLVEDEQWAPAEISPSLQHITDVIVDSAVRDAPELVIKSDADTIFSPLPSSSHTASATPQPPQPAPGKPDGAAGFGMAKAAGAKHLRIEERTYFAVSATAEVLVLLLDYLRLVVNLTMLTTDTMSRVIEFLKAFNSRTCQVVLGAGAMRSAGLKHITAKHLALASQSLSIMFELIPYVRETFRRHLSQKQAVMLVEFDKLKRDYQEHQNEIHSKLVAIMGERLNVHIKSLQAVDWNVPKPGGGVNDYIEILAKETVNLHKILSRYLSTQVVEYVMTQVFAAINHGLSEEYGRIELPHQEAKTRLLEDAKYLHQKLSALKNVGAPSGMLVTVISEKSLPRSQQPSSPPPVPTPTRSNTLSANQRLRGLLSGKSATFEKALPTPTRTSSLAASTSLSPTLLSRSASPAPAATVNPNVNGESVVLDDSDRSTSTAITTSTSGASPPSQAQKASSGFKQVEDMLMPGSDSESARGPDGPTDASAKLPGSGTLPLPPPDLQHRSPSPPLPPPPPHDTPSPPAPEVAASSGSASVSTGSEPESQAKPNVGGGEAGTWTRGSAAPAPGAATAADTNLGSSAPVPSQSDSQPLPPTPPAAAAAPDSHAQ
ncbi:putative vps54-like protein [Lyophyllum shimeji]|uniref:Vps54-like protein n=1 Tax=Lyophyllum shimeji TaxID=47721 RepID=A0A9P3UKP8_LYOSH|nr:putative vps54-like protein [Lyophyllum shimeji]